MNNITIKAMLCLAIVFVPTSLVSAMSSSDAIDGACEYKSYTGTYTNLFTHPESGDLLGIEVSIYWTRKTYYVVFQSSEGEPTPPVVAKASIEDGNINFILPEQSPYREFKGNITFCEITGSFVGGQLSPSGEKEFTLKKGTSFWQR